MSESFAVQELLKLLGKKYGQPQRVGKSRIFTFGDAITCSINYSKMLGGHKFFFGLAKDVPNPCYAYPETKLGDYVLLVCGTADATLVIPREVVINALKGVESRKIDIFVDDGVYIMQTTQHPKIDATSFLNALPKLSKAPVGESDSKSNNAVDDRIHLKMQWSLIRLGKAEGCTVWVPENDRGLSFRGNDFAACTLAKLPNFGFDENARRIVRNIDALWINRNVITKAFEIESTTAIYSGL